MLQHIFGSVSHPTDFLYDKTMHVLEEDFFSTDCPLVGDCHKWYYAYDEMFNAAKNSSVLLDPERVVDLAFEKMRDTIQIGILDLEYARIREDALNSDIYFDFLSEENKIVDRTTPQTKAFPAEDNTSVNGAYNICNIFMVSPTVLSTATLNPTFNIGELVFMTDNMHGAYLGGELHLLIDFGNGAGMQEIFLIDGDNNIDIEYPEKGEYIIEAVAIAGAEIVKRSLSRIVVNDGLTQDELFELGVLSRERDDFNDLGLNVFEYSSQCSDFADEEKIIFIVSGYNALSFSERLGKRGILDLYEKYILNGKLHNLISFGYRFVIVDWKNPNDDLRVNAERLRDLMHYYICEATNEEQFVVIGQSMGCLIARYALTRMEGDWSCDCRDEKKHNTRLFISNDGPHQGANIPMSIQCLYGKMFKEDGPLSGVIEFLNSLAKANLNFDTTLLNGTAVCQMLNAHYSTGGEDNVFAAHPLHDEFFIELANLGDYPTLCKNVALSNGTLDGYNQLNAINKDGVVSRFCETERAINDNLFCFNNEMQFRVLGFSFSNHLHLNLRTNPNGSGLLYNVEHFKIKPKLEVGFWNIQIEEERIGACESKVGHNLLPYCVSPGGYVGLEEGSSFAMASYLQCGIPWLLEFRDQMTLQTDGLGFSLIPVASALDYEHQDLNLRLSELSNDEIMSKTPFDVIIGRTGLDVSYNEHHESLLNHVLFSNDTVYYDDNLTKRLLVNAEIGDFEIYLENAELSYGASLRIRDNIYLRRAPYYEYPSRDILQLTHPYVKAVSREDDYIGGDLLQGYYNGSESDVPFWGEYEMEQCALNPFYISKYKDFVGNKLLDNDNTILQPFLRISQSEELTLSNLGRESCSLSLYNIYGDVVLHKDVNMFANTIQISNLTKNSLYILGLQTQDGEIITSKILVY